VDTTAPVLINLQDSPDPFQPARGQSAAFAFRLSEPAYVTIKVYNTKGTLVRTLHASTYFNQLVNVIPWNGKNASGAIVPAGQYIYKVWVWDQGGNRAIPYPAAGSVTVQ